MRPTSSVKELEAILQKLIKSEPGLIPVNNDNEKHLDDVDGDADVLDFLTKRKGLGSGQQRNEKMVLTRKMRK